MFHLPYLYLRVTFTNLYLKGHEFNRIWNIGQSILLYRESLATHISSGKTPEKLLSQYSMNSMKINRFFF